MTCDLRFVPARKISILSKFTKWQCDQTFFCETDRNFAAVMIYGNHGIRCYEKVGISDKLRSIGHFQFRFVSFRKLV